MTAQQRGSPWHNPHRENPPALTSDAWWDAVRPNFEKALIGCQLPPNVASELAKQMRAVYTDVRECRLFDDTVEVLATLHRDGWNHAILSNHVPELPLLIAGLGLRTLIGPIVKSAETGFEKPHPGAFRAALAALSNPSEVWMIGDNVEADVVGAESAGLRAILVRGEDPRAKRCAKGLIDVLKFIDPES